jgi:hypothetical protein
VAKQSSNQSGPGRRAKTVDKPTSNVATRPTRTAKREHPHTPTRSSNRKGLSQTECHPQDPNPQIHQGESSLILGLPVSRREAQIVGPPFSRRLSPVEADLGGSHISGRRIGWSAVFPCGVCSVDQAWRSRRSKLACPDSRSGFILNDLEERGTCYLVYSNTFSSVSSKNVQTTANLYYRS